MMIPAQRSAVLTATKKVRGLLDKIDALLDEDRYCIDIAQQVNAAIGLLRGANREILVSHLQTCGSHKLASPDAHVRKEFIDEVLRVADVTSRKA